MRSLASLLVVVAGSTAWGAAPSQNDTLRIAALDCEFRLPTTFTVKIGNEPGAFHYESNSLELRNFTFAPLDVAFAEGAPPPLTVEQRGPLTVKHYAMSVSGRSPQVNYFMTLIRGQSQQLRIAGLPPEQVERHVAHCLDTMDPAVAASSKRRASGCASELLLENAMNAVIGQSKYVTVFSGGKLVGWRIQEVDAASALSSVGVSQGSLLTEICGIPADELMANPDNVCCATDTSQEISATFRSGGGPSKSIVIKRGT